jgi:DHA3 family tetracycline resistance protein-like MFS transporter
VSQPDRRQRAFRTWLTYQGAWGLISTLSWTTAVVYFVRDLGLSPLQLVLAGTALELAYFVCEIPTGVIADAYSRKASVVIAAAVSGLGMLLVVAGNGFGFVAGGMAVWGFGWTFRSGAEDAWLADEVGSDLLGAAYQRGAQVSRIAGLLGIGVAVALALVDLRLPFAVAGGTSLALSGWLAAAMPETRSRSPRTLGRSPLGRSRLGRSAVGRVSGRARELGRQVRAGGRLVRGTPLLVLVLGIFFMLGAFEESFDRLWEAHLLVDLGLGGTDAAPPVVWFGGLAAATLLLSFAVAAPLVSRVERLSGARLARGLALLHALLLVFALGFAVAGSLTLAVAAYLATAVVRELAGPPVRTWINASITDSSVRATVLSFTSVLGSLGEWAGGPALGAVGTRWGVRTALASGALLLVPVVGLFARATRHHGVEPELATAEPGQDSAVPESDPAARSDSGSQPGHDSTGRRG